MKRISEVLGEQVLPEGLDRLYLQDVLEQDLKVFAFQERQGRFRDFLLCLVPPIYFREGRYAVVNSTMGSQKAGAGPGVH